MDQIQIYPEYSGTILTEHLNESMDVLQEADSHLPDRINERLERNESTKKLKLLGRFGFDNPFVLVMLREKAADLKIIGADGKVPMTKLAAASKKEPLKLGSTADFDERKDGLDGLKEEYGLTIGQHLIKSHDEVYDCLDNREVDVIDGYATDAELIFPRFVEVKEDSRSKVFTSYWASPLVVEGSVPEPVKHSLHKLTGKVSQKDMIELLADARKELAEADLKSDERAQSKLEAVVRRFLVGKALVSDSAPSPTRASPALPGPVVDVIGPKNNARLLQRVLTYEWSDLPGNFEYLIERWVDPRQKHENSSLDHTYREETLRGGRYSGGCARHGGKERISKRATGAPRTKWNGTRMLGRASAQREPSASVWESSTKYLSTRTRKD